MNKETDFLLGRAFALLTLCRSRMILADDRDGLQLLEDQYLEIETGIQDNYYYGSMRDIKRDIKDVK